MVKIKQQIRWLKKSNAKYFDFFQLIFAYLFRPKNAFISSRIKFNNKGKANFNGHFYFGILCNKLTASTKDYGVLNISKKGVFITDNHVKFSAGCRVFINGKLSIGENTYLNPNSIIVADEEITIGSNCAISWNVQIMDTDIHTLVVDGISKVAKKPIKIGNNVWIGSNVTILKGTVIGENTVVAAGAVVSGCVPSNVLVAGIPARVVKEQVNWNA